MASPTKPDTELPPPHLLRQRLGLTQDELADLLSTSQPTISKWERGRPPSLDVKARYRRLVDAERLARDSYRTVVTDLYKHMLSPEELS